MEPAQKVAVLKSLADELRLSIVQKLLRDDTETPSSELVNSCANVLKLSQPTMSHHFSRLVQAGVLSERKSGTEKFYQINRDLLVQAGVDPTNL